MLGLGFQLSPSCTANTHAAGHTIYVYSFYDLAADLPGLKNCVSRGMSVPAQCCHTAQQRTGLGRVEGEKDDRANKIHVRKNDTKEIKERKNYR